MTGIVDLDTLLASMEPELQPGEFVFCTLSRGVELQRDVATLATFMEKEGLTLIIDAVLAVRLDCPKSGLMRQISLKVHSSLDAVGLTAAISAELTRHRISANVVAAFYHDHIFVGTADAERAVAVLKALSEASRSSSKQR